MKTFYGKAGIKVTVLADSINKAGNRFITFEIEYWRGILAEFNTHRALSKNSFSSRAVPFEKMLPQLTGMPVRFGANQAGMQDKGEDFEALVDVGPAMGLKHAFTVSPRDAWNLAKEAAIKFAQAFKEAGYHKQVYNRRLEADQMMKTIVSGTEWSNFFWLRDDDAADPSLHELARVMREAAADSVPVLLEAGEWHLPYVDSMRFNGKQVFYLPPNEDSMDVSTRLTLEDAIMISCARCAAVSYRNEGYGLEKSRELYYRLVGADRKHASALEHCATPMKVLGPREISDPSEWEPGVTHMDRKFRLWSGNLCGWIQHRKTIPGENYEG